MTDTPAGPMFPALTAAQLGRLRPIGRERVTARGDVLVRIGDRVDHLYVLLDGALEIIGTQVAAERSIATMQPGQFTGEVSMLSGRPGVARIVASGAGTVLEVDRAPLLHLLQSDPELGELMMRAFILRRAAILE